MEQWACSLTTSVAWVLSLHGPTLLSCCRSSCLCAGISASLDDIADGVAQSAQAASSTDPNAGAPLGSATPAAATTPEVTPAVVLLGQITSGIIESARALVQSSLAILDATTSTVPDLAERLHGDTGIPRQTMLHTMDQWELFVAELRAAQVQDSVPLTLLCRACPSGELDDLLVLHTGNH
jgi:hypothetical protein